MDVIHDLDVAVEAGQVVAVIGSSGSGKSLLAHAIMGLLPGNARMGGTIIFDGAPLNAAKLDKLRGKDIAIVPQSVTYLDPLMRVGKQVQLAAAAGTDAKMRQRESFARNRLAESTERLYPHELSGGMARRVLASTALISGARLIVADEPTPGLNEEAARETARQFRELADGGCAVLFITHDIRLALSFADRIVVLYGGTVMENAAAADFTGGGERLRHPYTKALWRALPGNGFEPLAGSQPHPDELPPGCLFAPRCGYASEKCQSERPELTAVNAGTARCFHAS
ncbi:ATP-binding cassette domain-containing protein [Paenibacillus sp. NEAU-GSW1]|nr:ATP-binding cassette domain-containing protein [Paenibacillus sp. NEAU-GSW1]